jgi:hypothetical protein
MGFSFLMLGEGVDGCKNGSPKFTTSDPNFGFRAAILGF